MTEHKKEKHGVKCQFCNYVGSSKGSLEMHMRNSHKKEGKVDGSTLTIYFMFVIQSFLLGVSPQSSDLATNEDSDSMVVGEVEDGDESD